MINNKKILAIIPARERSKRLPGKNTMKLAGKPMIAWSIESANKSKYIDEIIVSTDSNKIKEVAKYYGAKVPFLRPAELASDTAKTIDVVNHVLDYLDKNKTNFNYIILLQPTSPLRTSVDIDHSIEMLNERVCSVVSVCEAEHSPLWYNTLPENHSMKNFISQEIKNIRSQDLPQYYRLNGAIYLSDINHFKKSNGFLGDKTFAYIMDRKYSIDIDNNEDFDYCEYLITKKNKL